MGVTYRNNGAIKDYWPDDDENTLHLQATSNHSLQDIMDRIKEKWGDVPFDSITITGEKIHTSCLTYDCYDPSDYTDFIILTKSE